MVMKVSLVEESPLTSDFSQLLFILHFQHEKIVQPGLLKFNSALQVELSPDTPVSSARRSRANGQSGKTLLLSSGQSQTLCDFFCFLTSRAKDRLHCSFSSEKCRLFDCAEPLPRPSEAEKMSGVWFKKLSALSQAEDLINVG